MFMLLLPSTTSQTVGVTGDVLCIPEAHVASEPVPVFGTVFLVPLLGMTNPPPGEPAVAPPCWGVFAFVVCEPLERVPVPLVLLVLPERDPGVLGASVLHAANTNQNPTSIGNKPRFGWF